MFMFFTSSDVSVISSAAINELLREVVGWTKVHACAKIVCDRSHRWRKYRSGKLFLAIIRGTNTARIGYFEQRPYEVDLRLRKLTWRTEACTCEDSLLNITNIIDITVFMNLFVCPTRIDLCKWSDWAGFRQVIRVSSWDEYFPEKMLFYVQRVMLIWETVRLSVMFALLILCLPEHFLYVLKREL